MAVHPALQVLPLLKLFVVVLQQAAASVKSGYWKQHSLGQRTIQTCPTEAINGFSEVVMENKNKCPTTAELLYCYSYCKCTGAAFYS
jgi:hypothetical protein